MSAVEYMYDLGYRYRRYPDSARRAHRVYWQRRGVNGVHYYHRDLWEKHYGLIPDGFHVHHVDHNYDNNQVGNFALLNPSEHLSHHGNNPSDEHRAKRKANMDRIRPLTKEWHKTECGQAHHRRNGILSHELRARVVLVCAQCGGDFEAEANSRATVCSNACKSKRRRVEQKDFVNAPCIDCGVDRWRSKYQRQSPRCVQCANKLKRKAVVS